VTKPAPPEQTLLDLLWSIREYLPQILIIGGWVPHLYRRYGGFSAWSAELSFTYEMDVLVDRSLPPGHRAPLAELLKAAGLHPADSDARGAIWEGESSGIAKMELFTPHVGTARRQAEVTSIKQQPNLAGISLTDTELLREHTTSLTIPMRRGNATIQIIVPSLGAFVATKAATFFKRPPDARDSAGGHPKSAKDLLYIRDLLAAGPDVVRDIERDVEEIRDRSSVHREALQKAATRLDIALKPQPKAVVLEAVGMLAERDRMLEGQARADLIGHLIDAMEILRAGEQTIP
jgi:hypothetical protein